MDPSTQSILFNASSLGMEYHSILMNCTMLGFTFQQVFFEKEFHSIAIPTTYREERVFKTSKRKKKSDLINRLSRI